MQLSLQALYMHYYSCEKRVEKRCLNVANWLVLGQFRFSDLVSWKVHMFYLRLLKKETNKTFLQAGIRFLSLFCLTWLLEQQHRKVVPSQLLPQHKIWLTSVLSILPSKENVRQEASAHPLNVCVLKDFCFEQSWAKKSNFFFPAWFSNH